MTFSPPLQQKLQLITVLGAGLLCGTALSIIIPEGVELVQEAWKGETSHQPHYYYYIQGINYMHSHAHFCNVFVYFYPKWVTSKNSLLVASCWADNDWKCLPIPVSSPPRVDWYCSEMGENQKNSESNATLHLAARKGLRPQFFIGVSLVLGFTLMFVVDQIANYCSMHGTSMLLLVRNTLLIHSLLPYRSYAENSHV